MNKQQKQSQRKPLPDPVKLYEARRAAAASFNSDQASAAHLERIGPAIYARRRKDTASHAR